MSGRSEELLKASGQRELRILILEDNSADAELVERELRKADLVFSAKRVETRDSFIDTLRNFVPDLILADYTLPAFDGLTALSLTRERYLDLPFIFVTGTLGEEVAIETLKRGATDYVLKQRLARLGSVVQRALREAEAQRERSRMEQLKGELLDVLSHELRTPLTVLQEGVNQLAEELHGTMTLGQQECCQALSESAQRLQALFQKVLLATQVMTGRLKYVPQPTKLEKVMWEVEATFKPAAQVKEVALRVDSGKETATAVVDPKRLGEVLSQLVENAIEATPKGGEVTLSSSTTPDGLELSVHNTGDGIPEEELPHLFERFRWIGDIDERKTGGLGLGLFIAQALVQAQGGSISVSSTPGQGTRMVVSLKQAPESTAQGATSA